MKSGGNTGFSEIQPVTPPAPVAPPASAEPATPSSSTATLTLPAPELDPTSPAPRPVAPSQIRDPERYQIIAEHGHGGLGRVSRAHDRELGRDVAIKELLSRSRESEGRFLREALITARLEHPGIVPVHDAGRWPDGTLFYAMKLVSGRPLRDLIAERTAEQRIGLLHHVIAVAEAIAYAHDRNIIHRDLKPANVIVGDFGETMVIDWGLAKDVTAQDDASAGPFRSPPADDLTTTGGILGTPGYMAPEQRRGESVDRRADVFAIGVMLREICAVQEMPWTEEHDRYRTLRRTGIDPDLATILEKALDPDPRRRYPHAGALAADLKAFTSGARIAARSYSLPEILAHWIRRHRALALSLTAALVVAATGVALYVRNIAAEREIAERAQTIAERAQVSTEAALDELTLKHAELLLTTDPSAAIHSLATYHGADRNRVDQIRAEATGRGVAFLRAMPHTDNVLWAEGVSHKAIVSLSRDGTISRTSLDGTSVLLARDVAQSGHVAYSPVRHLLAYACDPSDVCLLDILHGARIPIAPILRDAHVAGLSFSPDGALLALMSQEAVLRVLDVTNPAQPLLRLTKNIQEGIDVKFLDEHVVAAGTAGGVELLRMNGDAESFSLPDGSNWDARASEHKLALATTLGQAFVLEAFPVHVTARADLCQGPIVALQFIPGQPDIAYACRDGAVGIWNLQRGKAVPRAQLEGHADLMVVSPTGDYIVAAAGNGTVAVLDLRTNLATSYKGHGFRLTSITPPTLEYPFVISADVRGAVRAWPLPARFAHVAATTSSPMYTAMYNRQSATVTVTTSLPALTTFSPSAGVRIVKPHDPYNTFLEQSTNGRTFATYGRHDLVEVWSSATMTRAHLLHTEQGSISQLRFVDDTDDLVTAGHDGRLVRWTPGGGKTLIVQVDQPIERFARAPATGSLVFSTADGALWHVDASGRALSLRGGGSRVNRILTLPDQQTVYAGYASGDVIGIDTKSWQQEIIMHASGAVHEIAVAADGRTIAVATNDGIVHVGTRRGDTSTSKRMAWATLAARARHLSLAPDGLLMAACADGTIWLYSPARQRWLCLPTGIANLGWTVMTASGDAAAALDLEGRLIWIDLHAVRELLDVRAASIRHDPYKESRI